MPKTTVLFVCPDNSLLSPLAEAYLNFRAGGLMRAFSAGAAPSQSLSRHVHRLLSARGIDASGLAPKSVDIFLMPHAEIPDRVIYLADQAIGGTLRQSRRFRKALLPAPPISRGSQRQSTGLWNLRNQPAQTFRTASPKGS